MHPMCERGVLQEDLQKHVLQLPYLYHEDMNFAPPCGARCNLKGYYPYPWGKGASQQAQMALLVVRKQVSNFA